MKGRAIARGLGLVIVACVVLGTHAWADPRRADRVLGVSNEALTGDAGLGGLTEACRQRFGIGARLCTSTDIGLSVFHPRDLPDGTAWVHPVVVESLGDGRVVDYAGRSAQPEALTCAGWSRKTNALTGLAANARLGFELAGCAGSRPAMCCRP